MKYALLQHYVRFLNVLVWLRLPVKKHWHRVTGRYIEMHYVESRDRVTWIVRDEPDVWAEDSP